MKCDEFQAACAAGVESTEILAHLRECEACLNYALERDPDFMFRAIGGDIEPPEGAAAFASGVMREIHIRETEKKMAPHVRWFASPRRWAIAAAAAVAVISGVIMFPRSAYSPVPASNAIVAAAPRPVVLASNVSKPVVERYSSSSATIVEVPQEETSDLKVVMIFDESLPADL